MVKSRKKLVIATVAVASAYAVSAWAMSGNTQIARVMRVDTPLHLPGQYVAALLPALVLAFYLAIDALLPIRRSVLDMAHAGLAAAHRHLFIDGARDNYWHLRIAIAVCAIVAIQILADAMDILRAG